MPTRRPRQNDQRAKICEYLFDNRRNGAGKRDRPSAGCLRQACSQAINAYVAIPPDIDAGMGHTGLMIEDFEQCYRAATSKDPRFDGWFFTAVTSTRIYCRPSCPAMTPKRENVRFYPSAAAAQQAGFRACKRCRPDATPGSPDWDLRADLVGRAMRLIADGVVDREGVGELIRIATERGRKVRKNLKLGICGEHGGDPASVVFCHEVGLDYVSCSPFRVPIARLAAAQAALGKEAASNA